MKSPQSHFITQMFFLSSSHVCYVAGSPPIPLPDGGSPPIFLGGQPLPLSSTQVGVSWLINVLHPVTTTTGLTAVGVNTRNFLEHLDKGLSWLNLILQRLAAIFVTTWEESA